MAFLLYSLKASLALVKVSKPNAKWIQPAQTEVNVGCEKFGSETLAKVHMDKGTCAVKVWSSFSNV